MADYLDLIPFVLAVMLAGSTGAIFAPGDWYEGLKKPSWTPPNWLFPVAWTALYVLIAAAGWLVWRAEGVGLALMLWVAQLVLNAAWSWIMFGRKNMGLALIDAIGMWVLIAAFMAAAWPVSPWATWLFAPYLAWVTVAVALNLAVLRMNPGGGSPQTAA